MRTRVLVLTAVLSIAVACGSSGPRDGSAEPSTDPAPSSTGGPMPTRIPAASGKVSSRGLVTILDDGNGPELCFGAVAASFPPQCGGPHVVGFDWSDRSGQFEHAIGVRWGAFAVTGTFDGTSFTVARTVPAASYDPAAAPADVDRFATPCPEPVGGWRVLDPSKTTDQSLQAVFARASQLTGYADAWMDQSRDPADGRDEGDGHVTDPAHVTVNVRVTEDVDDAEAELRKIWGGALCVTKAQRSEEELTRIQAELLHLPGLLSDSTGRGVVEVEVVHDDGSLQAWSDAVYGPGVVRISSALVPASG